jgi:membrane protease YdiL (CAAX protease family)
LIDLPAAARIGLSMLGAVSEHPPGESERYAAVRQYSRGSSLPGSGTVLGEELLFRGLLLPRMRDAFGRGDWVANGVLFAVYHLHQPWDIPITLVDIIALSYPSRRFQSAWMGIIVHSTQSVVILIVVLTLVLA